jgi:hypothetical protein
MAFAQVQKQVGNGQTHRRSASRPRLSPIHEEGAGARRRSYSASDNSVLPRRRISFHDDVHSEPKQCAFNSCNMRMTIGELAFARSGQHYFHLECLGCSYPVGAPVQKHCKPPKPKNIYNK